LKNHETNIRPGYLRPHDAARYVGVSDRTIRDWQQRRLIPFTKMGRRCALIAVKDLDAVIAAGRIEAIGGAA
jgi:excisionase family DNA binding protein